MNKLLILDGNNILIRALYASMTEELRTQDGRTSGVLFRAMNTLLGQLNTFRPTHFVCAFDYGRSKYRVEHYPDYKANRDEDDSPERQERKERFLKELSLWKEAMDDLFLSYVSERKVEADDIIAALTVNHPGQKIVISSDHDLLQLVSPSCHVHKVAQTKKHQSVTFTPNVVQEQFGVSAEELPYIWALAGDKGDNIIGLHRVGVKTAVKKFLENNKDFMETVNALAKTDEDKERVIMNLDLVRLHPELATDLPHVEATELDYDLLRGDLKNLAKKWDFNSFTDKIDRGWLKPANF